MSTMKFVKLLGPNEKPRKKPMKFDSSPQYSICKSLGLHEASFSLRNETNVMGEQVWEVYGSPTGGEPYLIGHLFRNEPVHPGGGSRKFR